VDCQRTETITSGLDSNEYEFGDYSDGRWAFMFTNLRVLPAPIPAKGALSLWDWIDVNHNI